MKAAGRRKWDDRFERCPHPKLIVLRYSFESLVRGYDGMWRWADTGVWPPRLLGPRGAGYKTRYGAMMAAKRQDDETRRTVARIRGLMATGRKGTGWPRGIRGTGFGGVKR